MKIAIIGAGKMGGAFARGLVAQGLVPAAEIICTAATEKTLVRLAEEIPGVATTTDNARAVAKTVCSGGLVALAVKPWLAQPVLASLRESFAGAQPVLVSFAAGVSLAQLRAFAGMSDGAIFSAIPNTAIAVAQSMTFVAAEETAPVAARERVVSLFSKLGRVALVPEKQLAAGTALASCGLAFAMRYARASMEGGIELGLHAEDARLAVLQTLKGAAELLLASGEHPESAIDKVSTPGGLTIRGLNAMEAGGFSSAVVRGLRAAGTPAKPADA